MTLRIIDTQYSNALINSECRYAECHPLFIVMLSAIMLNVTLLSVMMLNVVPQRKYYNINVCILDFN